MKKSVCLFTLGMIAALSVPAFFLIGNAKDVHGYNKSSLPTTIDLNDTSDSNIRSYYSTLNNLSDSERQGTNLLKNLKTILKNGQKYYSYDTNNGDDIWKMYEITDRDWDKSPASKISGYNSSTKKITGYSYNSTDPYVRALYINRDVNNQTTAWSDHQQTQWGINREHVWPKAEGFDSSGAGGARGDPRHLMAGNGYANNIHSNNYYGYVDRSKSYTDCGNKYSNLSGNLSGKSSTLGGTTTVFEPQDSDKGDIARSIFYMVARYNYYSGSDSDGIDANNPNLQLTQSLSDWADQGYTSTTSNPGKMGIMTDLLAWHHADPVDEIEIHRNNLLYTNFTNNRNPFIDFPQWADFIWGSVNYNGRSYISHSTEPTGYATPSSDTINGYNGGGSTVSVTGVSLNKNSTSIQVGSAETLEATVAPSNATNKNVSWTSSNSNVATVSSGGVVRGVSEGNSTITVTTSDGGYTATCTVTVTASGGGGGGEGEETLAYTLNTAAGEIPIATSNTYANYAETDSGYKWTINCGSKQTNSPVGLWLGSNDKQKAKMILSNGSYSEASGIASAIGVSASSTYYAAIFQQSGGTALSNIKKVTLTYDSTGGTAPSEAWVVYSTNNGTTWNVFEKQTTLPNTGTDFEVDNAISSAIYGFVIHSTGYCQFKVPVLQFYSYEETPSSKALGSITLDTSDAPTTFNVGDEFSYEGLAVTANYDDGTSDIVTPTSVSTPSLASAGQKTVTVSYTEGGVTKTATYTITVNAVTLTSIEVSEPKTAYYVGDSFVKPTVTATFSNGSTSDVTNSATFSGYNLSNAGNQTVTVSYTNSGTTRTTSYSITVTEVALTSIEVSGQKTTYYVGDSFVKPTVTANFNNGSTSTVTNSATFSGYNMSSAGNQTVTVSYTTSGVTKTTTYNITVTALTLTSITISGYTTEFDVGDVFSFGGTVTANYNNGTTANVTASATFSGYNMSSAGDQTVTVSYGGKSTTYSITVTDPSAGPTASVVIQDYASANSWENSIAYSTVNIDGVITVLAVGTGNNGKYYTSGYEWRFYQYGGGGITISAADNYVIDSVVVNYNISNTGILIDSSENTVFSGVSKTVNAQSVTYTVANSGSATNGQAKITSIDVYYHSTSTDPMTEIIATVSKSFAVGETITKSDISVCGDNGEIVTDFSFANNNYQFTYADAVSGGSSTSKTFTNAVTYESFTASLTVNVTRTAYVAPSTSESTYTGTQFKNVGIASSYTTNQTATIDGVTFNVDGYVYKDKLSLSNSSTSAPGSVINSTPYDGGITNVTVTGATPDIQLSTNGSAWVDLSSATPATVTYKYFKLFYKNTSQTAYVNITNFVVTARGIQTAINVANYIMYEDTANQCTTKFDIAESYFNAMTVSERSTFMTSSDYIIATARERFNAWARSLGHEVSLVNGDYVVNSIRTNPVINVITGEESGTSLIVLISFILGLGTVGGYLVAKKRKQY